MSNAQMPWKACVLTIVHEPSDYRNLKNAVLYATHVHWLPFEAQFMRALLGAFLLERDLERNGTPMSGSILDPAGFDNLYAMHTEFLEQLRRSGLDAYVNQSWTPLENLEQIITEPHIPPEQLIDKTVCSAM